MKNKLPLELNSAATERMRALIKRLTEQDMLTPVGQHWTVSIAFAHLAFWDRRALYVLELFKNGKELSITDIDCVNDISLPLWGAIPPHESTRIALETAETLDKEIDSLPPDLLEKIYNINNRWVLRGLHRNEHLDDIESALNS